MQPNPSISFPSAGARARRPSVSGLWAVMACVLAVVITPAFAQEPGRVSGTVASAATGGFLNGAVVEVPQLQRVVSTDSNGHFVLTDLPPGEYTIAASYTGLDNVQKTVRVAAGERVSVAFRLSAEVYKMDIFQVSAAREGQAAAITRQRDATNLINAAATDAFGSLANQNPGEVFMRIPGVSAGVGEDNEVGAVAIRGMASTLNNVTMDGAILAPVATNVFRAVRFQTNVTAQFDEFQVVKGMTPDMDGGSMGGTLIMKTKSPLGIQGDNLSTYRIGMRWAPPFAPHNPIRRDRPIQPDLSYSYQGVFDVLGGKRNLGMVFNATYFESVGDYIRTIRDYQSTLNPTAFMWDYHVADYYFNRHLQTVSTRIDYQLSESTRLSLRGTVNDYNVFGGHIYNESRAFTAQTVATLDASGQPTGTGAILPNFTDTRTEARPVAGSQFQMLVNSVGQLQRQRTVQFVIEHQKDRFTFNLDMNAASGWLDQMSGLEPGRDKNGGTFNATITGVGYVIDSSKSREFPTFTQTAGPSVYNINNYRNGLLTLASGRVRSAHVYAAKTDAKYNFGPKLASSIKGGLSYRRNDSIGATNNRQFTYAGPDGVVGTTDDTLAPFADAKIVRSSEYLQTGFNVPLVHIGSLTQNLKDHPNYWAENVYYRQSQWFIGNNGVYEDVSAAFLMATTRLGKLNILGGARIEETEVESIGRVINKTRADITDPVLRAATEYTPRKIKGSYSNVLPSLHLTYALLPNLISRASYSNGIGRPPYSNLLPTENVNDTSRTVTISNPALKAQTARNFDLGLEYYMKGIGLMSVGVFQKDIKNFIFSSSGGVIGSGNDNGFSGQYSGYTMTTQLNGGTAQVKGLELNLQKQIDFGPEWMHGISVFGNYTSLTAEGNYGTGTTQSVSSLAEFVPKFWNAGGSFSRGKFRTNILVNSTGEYLFTYSATPARLLYKQRFVSTTLSFNYAWRPKIEFYCDINNLFNQPQRWYYGVPGHMQEYSRKGMVLSFGVKGRF